MTSYLACSNCLPTCIFPVCLEKLGPLNANGHLNFHFCDVLSKVAKVQGIALVLFFVFLLYEIIVTQCDA